MGVICDISQFNRITDWDALRGVECIIIRCGYSLSTQKELHICADQRFHENKSACEARSIPYTVYFFTNAITEGEAELEAMYVAEQCRGIRNYVLPVFVDTELVDSKSRSGRADNLSKEQRTRCVSAFCSTLQREGIPAGIYANDNWFHTRLDTSKLPYSKWVASWGQPPAWSKDFVLWQYTNKGSLAGISGPVDLSDRGVTRQGVADAVIDLALKEVGYLEKASGDLAYLYSKTGNVGSKNYTKYGYELNKLRPDIIGYPDYWCLTFVSWLFVAAYGYDEAREALCGEIDDWCRAMANRFDKAGRWIEKGGSPEVGDIVMFTDGSGELVHCGIIYEISAGRIRTIEGNTSSGPQVVPNGGGVFAKSYELNSDRIAGYCRPNYSAINGPAT